MSLSMENDVSAYRCSWSARRHIHARSQIHEMPAVDGICPELLRGLMGAYVLSANIRPDSEEGHSGHFARRQREAVSLGRRYIQSDGSLHILEGHIMVVPCGLLLRSNSSDQISQKSFTLHYPHNSNSRHSYLSRSRFHSPTVQVHKMQLPKQKSKRSPQST
jgi:hypothetical protein